jgi:hypothetical protein
VGAGTRITVVDVMDYLKRGWHRDRIAALFRSDWPRSTVARRPRSTMLRIMADRNVEGHLQVRLTIWSSAAWGDIWRGIGCDLESFERLGITLEGPRLCTASGCPSAGVSVGPGEPAWNRAAVRRVNTRQIAAGCDLRWAGTLGNRDRLPQGPVAEVGLRGLARELTNFEAGFQRDNRYHSSR